jgi:hypothetical protein
MQLFYKKNFKVKHTVLNSIKAIWGSFTKQLKKVTGSFILSVCVHERKQFSPEIFF